MPSPQPVYCNLRFGVNFSSSFTMEYEQLKVALGHNESIGMVPTAGDLGTFGLCVALVFVNEKMNEKMRTSSEPLWERVGRN